MSGLLKNCEEAGMAETSCTWQVSGRRQGKPGHKNKAGRFQVAASGLPKLIP